MNILDKDLLVLLNLSLEGIFIENVNGDILMCNQSGAEIFGYTIEEITKLNIRDLIPTSERYYLKEQYTQEDLFPHEYIDRLNVKKDGTLIRTEINSKIITSNGEEYLIAFVRDATKPAQIDPNNPKVQMSVSFLECLRKEKQILLTLQDSVGREKCVVPLVAVEYIESSQKKLKIYLTNGSVLEAYGTLNRLEQQIPSVGSFLRCYQSYIINMQYAELDECHYVFVMRSGARVPIRKRQYRQIRQAYNNYKILLQ
ncbi:PAS domain S-box protein [Oscillospiraceae bacterium LTW-04]|nr:PAS domain S-box protein [Oscillospiraceae bacterium MB24-C1]